MPRRVPTVGGAECGRHPTCWTTGRTTARRATRLPANQAMPPGLSPERWGYAKMAHASGGTALPITATAVRPGGQPPGAP